MGPMNIECRHCHALHWDSEKLSSSTRADKKFGGCCLQGQVMLPPLPPPPMELRHLLYGTSPWAHHFKDRIHQYNAAFAFTSLGVKIDHKITNAPGPYCFRINGELHHLSGALLPPGAQEKTYAQIYIHDPAEQLAIRQRNNTNLNSVVMTQLQGVLNAHHPYVPLYK